MRAMKTMVKNTVILDPNKFKILLIGVWSYKDPEIPKIPNIKVNIKELSKLFTNPRFLGVPKENIITSENESLVEIRRKLYQLADISEPEDTVIIYYTGHGFLSEYDLKLYLATADSTHKFLEAESLSGEQFKFYLERMIVAERKILIIDACYSGRLINTLGDTSAKLYEAIGDIKGTYVLVSSDENVQSLYPANTPTAPTYFTAALIETIKYGVPNGKPYLTIEDVYRSIKQKLRQYGNNLPEPKRSVKDDAERIPIAKNVYYEEHPDLFMPKFPAESYFYVQPKNNSKDISSLVKHLSLVLVGILLYSALVFGYFSNYVVVDRADRAIRIEQFERLPSFDDIVEFNYHLGKARKFWAKQEFYNAKIEYEKALKIRSDRAVQQEYQKLLVEIDKAYKNYIDMAKKLIRNNYDLERAKYYIEQALRLKPHDSVAIELSAELESLLLQDGY